MRLALEHFNSLISLVNHFNNDKRCRDFITEQRWGKVVVCPFCGCTHIYECGNGDNQFKCAHCHICTLSAAIRRVYPPVS